MPRDHEHDDVDDYRDDHPPWRKSSGTNPALIVGLVLGGVLLLGLVVCGGFVFLLRSGPDQAPPQAAVQGKAGMVVQLPRGKGGAVNAQADEPAPNEAAMVQDKGKGPIAEKPVAPPIDGPAPRKTYTRDDFEKLVRGKSRDEVIAAVGRPDETSDTGELKLIYRKRTIDPLSGALDLLTSVHFRDGKAAEVNY